MTPTPEELRSCRHYLVEDSDPPKGGGWPGWCQKCGAKMLPGSGTWCRTCDTTNADDGGYGRPIIPRTLTASDPEPGVGSVVLLAVGNEAMQRSVQGWQGYAMHTKQWAEMFRFGPVTLIHDSGEEPADHSEACRGGGVHDWTDGERVSCRICGTGRD